VKKNIRKKLLIIHPALPPYRLDMFNALSERFDAYLVILRENIPEQKFNVTNLINHLKAGHEFLLKGFVIFRRIFRYGTGPIIRKFNPDVILASEFSPTTILVWIQKFVFFKKVKLVVLTEDNPELIKRDNVIRKIVRRVLLTGLDGLIVLSEETARLYREKYKVRFPIACYPTIQLESLFRGRLLDSKKEAVKLVLENNLIGKRVLLYVGRLAREKRVDRLITAFGAIHESMSDAVLVIVGDGPKREELKELARSLGISKNVVFTGRCEGIPLSAWYRLGSLFAIASEYEPFGCVVNEALLSGMPVICSSMAGSRTLIKNNVNGVVVNAENPLELQSPLKVWLKKTKPLSKKNILTLKPSKMLVEFDDVVDEVARLLKNV